MRTIISVFVVASSGLSTFSGDGPALEKLAEGMRVAWDAPGLVAVVTKGDQTLLLAGFGTRDHNRKLPIDADTLVPLGSCGKAFTSAAIASLVADGKMMFDDPVRKHLPDFKLSDPRADALVTIRDLLSHRSGLNGHDILWYRAPWSFADAVKRIPDLELAGPFRGSFHYSSLTVAAAGYAAMKANGTSYDSLIRDRVCRPAGIADIAFDTPQAKTFANRAEGFRRSVGGRIEPMAEYVFPEPHPAGSIQITGRGLEQWLKYQRTNASPSLTETKSPQTVIPMTDAVRPYHPYGTQVTYGMGWLIYDYRGKKIVAHGGQIDGFRAQVMLLPDEGIGIALVNTLHESKLNLALSTAIVDELLGLPKADWASYYKALEAKEREDKANGFAALKRLRRAGVTPTRPLADFAGTYRDKAYGPGTVTLEAGHLVWSWSSFRIPLEHWERDAFRLTGEPFENGILTFQSDLTGVKSLRFAERSFGRTK